ncbi:hypothetical protein FQA39_LY01964 [Lamprigera yunnana]|nr:hypothetical protein FQA39_LY01964 [Lamprigera yunnana]
MLFSNSLRQMRGTAFQTIAVLTGTLSNLSDGMHFGWMSPMGPFLLSPDSPIKADKSDISLLETLFVLGGLFGLPITIYLMDKIGPKKTILVAAVESLIAWIIIASTSSMALLFVARFIAGISGDVNFMAVPVYVAEISDKKIRGVLGSSCIIMLMLGILIIYAVGPYTSIPVSAAIGIFILLTHFLTFPFMPDSPYFLLMTNQKDKAKESLTVFRSLKDVEIELEEIADSLKVDISESKGFLDLFSVRSNLKVTMIITVLCFAQNFSGLTAMLMNVHSILNEAGGSISSNTAAILYSVMMLVGCIFCGILIDVTGRKILLCTSTLLTTISLFILAIYFTVKNNHINVTRFSWLPVFSVLLYAFTFEIGFAFVPTLLITELYPTNIKSKGIAYALGVFEITGILSLITYQLLQKFGMQVSFFLFGSCCALTFLFSVFVVPETKGKSFSEIQHLLKEEETPNVSNNSIFEESEETRLDENLHRQRNNYGTNNDKN